MTTDTVGCTADQKHVFVNTSHALYQIKNEGLLGLDFYGHDPMLCGKRFFMIKYDTSLPQELHLAIKMQPEGAYGPSKARCCILCFAHARQAVRMPHTHVSQPWAFAGASS